MSAFVRHEFRGGFVLAEEHLRKLKEISSSRIVSIDPETPIQIEVRRADSLRYTTSDVERVTSEQNLESERILGVALKAEREGRMAFNLDFDEEHGAALFITGEDRDAVFLLYSDIKAYIDAEVSRRFRIERSTFQMISMFVAFAAMVAFMTTILNNFDADAAKAALASSSDSAKLNYLIDSRLKQLPNSMQVFSFAAVFSLPLLFFTPIPFRVLRAIYPSNCFLIGKQKGLIEGRRRWASNVFWVVVVGGIVSLATGLLLK